MKVVERSREVMKKAARADDSNRESKRQCHACTQPGPNPSKTQEVQEQDKVHLMRRVKAIYGPEEQRQMVVADRGAWEGDWLSMRKGSCQIRK